MTSWGVTKKLFRIQGELDPVLKQSPIGAPSATTIIIIIRSSSSSSGIINYYY